MGWIILANNVSTPYKYELIYNCPVVEVIEGKDKVQEVVYRDICYRNDDLGSLKSINLTRMFKKVFRNGEMIQVKLNGTSYGLGLIFKDNLYVEGNP